MDHNKKMLYFKCWNCYSCYCCCSDGCCVINGINHREETQKQQPAIITDKDLIILTKEDKEPKRIPFESIVKIGYMRNNCILSCLNLETVYFEIFKDLNAPYLGNEFYYLPSVSPHPQQ
eukprot:343488_1